MNRSSSNELDEMIKSYENFCKARMEEAENSSTIPRDAYLKIVTDRLAFGFDSIYFRYAAAIDELAYLKTKDPVEPNKDPLWWRRWASNQKMHFWKVLEQLTGAHELEDNQKKAEDTDKDGSYGA